MPSTYPACLCPNFLSESHLSLTKIVTSKVQLPATSPAVPWELPATPSMPVWPVSFVRSFWIAVPGGRKDDIKFELHGLRSDKSRPGDVIWLGYSGPGRHLLIDGSIVGVFTKTTARESSRTPGHAAVCKEDEKLAADAASPTPVSLRHRLVPAVVEEGGRLGAHFQALFRPAPGSWPKGEYGWVL